MLDMYPEVEHRERWECGSAMKTMLLATDGSESSERALTFAIELAQETGASLEVVSVRPQWSRTGAQSIALELDSYGTCGQVAESAVARATRAGVTATAHVLEGDTVSCIIDTAARMHAELLVIGSRGLGSISGAILGSVSQALVRRSPVPVTIVRHSHALSNART
jgi:nucleotide-binding universal stress UspA family protein